MARISTTREFMFALSVCHYLIPERAIKKLRGESGLRCNNGLLWSHFKSSIFFVSTKCLVGSLTAVASMR